MLLKIDLLPAWVKERTSIRLAAIAGALMLAGVVVACFAYAGVLAKQVSEKEALLAQKTKEADQVRQLEAELKQVTAQIEPYRQRVDFCRRCENSGKPVAERIIAILPYIWSDVRLHSWSMSGQQVSMSGEILVKDPARGLESATLARLRLNFNQCPEFVPGSVVVNASGWTGWSFPGATPGVTAAPAGNPTFTLTATLRQPLTMPSFGAEAAAPGARRAPGGPAAEGEDGGGRREEKGAR